MNGRSIAHSLARAVEGAATSTEWSRTLRGHAARKDADCLARTLGGDAADVTGNNVFADFFSRDRERVHRAGRAFEWVVWKTEGLIGLVDEAVERKYYNHSSVAGALRLYIQGVLGDVPEGKVAEWARRSVVLAHPDKMLPQMSYGKQALREALADRIWRHHQKAAALVRDPSIRRAIYSVPCPAESSFPAIGLLEGLEDSDEGTRPANTGWRVLRRWYMALHNFCGGSSVPAGAALLVATAASAATAIGFGPSLVALGVVPVLAGAAAFCLARTVVTRRS